MIKGFLKSGNAQLSVTRVEKEDIPRYGVIDPGLSTGYVKGLIEKPNIKEAPSNLVSIGRYILTSEIFDILKSVPLGKNGELQLADAINIFAKKRTVEYVELEGERFDCGSVKGFVQATQHEYNKRGLNND